MNKLRTTILLTALVCIVFAGSGSVVFCQGEDGHAAIESAMHDHCHSHVEHAENDAEHGHNDGAVYLPQTHKHCSDTLLTTNIFVSAKKNTSDTNKVFASNICQYLVANSVNAEFGGHYSWNIESTPFFTPLRTIVLLA